ncbi:MAG: BT_2262 family domain-containing protein [Bacteroidota bacterium]
MKTKFSLIISVLSLLLLFACEKKHETDGLSTITNYPVFEMTGSDVVIVAKGTPFTDPGIKATSGGVEIEVEINVDGAFTGSTSASVNTDVCDKYVITYTAVNSDGFANSTFRTVWVCNTGDLTTNIEGLYTSTVLRGGVSSPQYTDMAYVLIWKTGDNTYKISDALGGYYSIGRVYGDAYAAIGGVITANNIPANDFSATTSVIPGFGNTVEITDMVVDAANKSISFMGVGNFANANFAVTLTQVQF